MHEFLITWIGATDLRAQQAASNIGLGPIAQAVADEKYSHIVLISDYPEAGTKKFSAWLQGHSSAEITLHPVTLTSPTNFGEIHQAVTKVVSAIIKQYEDTVNLTFHLSPGTPAMAAVWILLAKTRFPAKLIESSKEHGVKTVSIPFDISAEFLPDLLKKSDQTLKQLAAGLPSAAPEFADIKYRSEEMQRVVGRAKRVALHSIPVLIEGESGTGKELFARAIHAASLRKDKPFIAINCGAIPKELVETELFGHEKGAFTGATTSRPGHFETANTGTIFLDEIGELPKEMQVKLLRTLQEGEVKRVGANKVRKVDIRVISATNRNLIEEVANDSFREDLFYRLAVAVLKLPPLRERVGDINLLINHIMENIDRESRNNPGTGHKIISPSARNLMIKHSWPGNVRELQNTLTRAAIWSTDKEISEDDIKETILQVPDSSAGGESILNQSLEQKIDLPEVMKTVAVHYLERALEKNHGNKTKTAETLGLPSYQTLSNWLKKYDLE